MAQTSRVEANVDFQQLALPLALAIGCCILEHIRLEAESALGPWYELYSVLTPSGFLIEKHSGASRSPGKQLES
jgi:hypothetical protein